MRMTAETKQYCLLGDPVAHSLSPFIMNRAFAEHGDDASYAAFEVEPDQFVEAVRDLHALGVHGCNVTYPYKQVILRLVDRTSTEVNAIRAANTLVIRADGIDAFNTDASGTAIALEEFAGIDLAGKGALILGAGGAARAAAFGLLASRAGAVTFAVRDEAGAVEHIDRLSAAFGSQTIGLLQIGDAKGLRTVARNVDIIINATPVGMVGYDAGPLLRAAWIHPQHCCFDFVYHPRQTAFLQTAKERGATTLDGITLLVSQAMQSYLVWTGRDFPLRPMYDAVTAYVAERTFTDRG